MKTLVVPGPVKVCPECREAKPATEKFFYPIRRKEAPNIYLTTRCRYHHNQKRGPHK